MPNYLPELRSSGAPRSMVNKFWGLNKTPTITDGEFSDMKNLTSDSFPLLAVREPRGCPILKYADYADPETMTETEEPTQDNEQGDAAKPRCITMATAPGTDVFQPVYIDGSKLVIGYHAVDLGITDGEKQIVHMGAYLIVIPDMVYCNSKDLSDRGKIEDGFYGNKAHPVGGMLTDVKATMTMCDYDGRDPDYIDQYEPNFILFEGQYVDDDGVEYNPNGRLWQKTDEYDGLYRFSTDDAKWYKIKSYLKLKITAKTIAGLTISALTMKKVLREGDALRFENLHSLNGGITDGPHQVAKAYDLKDGGQIIVVEGGTTVTNLEIPQTDEKTIRVYRYIPNLDYACESGNRLWGCRYGENGMGQYVNEIYCSGAGDFFRWGLGEATDDSAPVTFSLGSDGAFTGAVNYGGYPTFFKERSMHRVSGFLPSEFGISTDSVPGVARQAAKSLAVVGGILYYKSPGAVMAFDGTQPVSVSDKLGSLTAYTRAVGGACGDKYYLYLDKSSRADPNLYVLDTTKGLWHREDETVVESMAEDSDNMYMIAVKGENHTVLTVKANGDPEKGKVRWYAETGLFGMESPDRKYVTRLMVKLKPEAGSSVRVSIQYNSTGVWKQLYAKEGTGMVTVSVPVLPAPCDHFRLRLEGTGGCEVNSITKTVRDGGESI
jgi:hypothetical protein